MAAIVPLFKLMQIDISNLSKQELIILEAELFISVCKELKEIFKKKYETYFRLTKLTKEMEEKMLDSNLVSLITKDILSEKEYTPQGIAAYTDFHEDVIVDIILEKNVCPSSVLLRRIIELHRSIRSELYQKIMRKIVLQWLEENKLEF